MTHCNIPHSGAAATPQQVDDQPLLRWLQAFNAMNYIGLAMFIAPVVFGYFVVHYWLLGNDLFLYYASLYAQLGLLFMAWRQL